MSLRDKPYLALYIQDFLTDEKLNECSASAVGVYIKIMCVMHKSEEYGKILLKQKDKQSDKQILNFATKLSKQLPFETAEIVASLTELVEEGVLKIDGDYLIQKRMVADEELSVKRSLAGSLGGKSTQSKRWNDDNLALPVASDFAKANFKANTDNDIDNDIIEENRGVGEGEDSPDEYPSAYHHIKAEQQKKTEEVTHNQQLLENMIVLEMMKVWRKHIRNYQEDREKDYSACLQFAYKIAASKGWKSVEVLNGKMPETLKSWEKIVEFIKNDKFYKGLALHILEGQWQSIYLKMANEKEEKNAKDPSKVKIVL